MNEAFQQALKAEDLEAIQHTRRFRRGSLFSAAIRVGLS